jgi:ParB family chromosome partitioning protein
VAKPNGAVPEMWQHRIIGYGFEDPEQLLANEANWRIHPLAQQQALSGVLQKVGWVANVLINKRTDPSWGKDQFVEVVVDGHLRVVDSISNNQRKVPTAYCDLLPEEEALILATYDPIGAMAVTDAQKLNELIKSSTPDMQVLMASIPMLADVISGVPNFQPVGIDEQGRLDQKKPITCPHCGAEFVPNE